MELFFLWRYVTCIAALGLSKDIDQRKPVNDKQKMYLELLNYFNSKGILIQNLDYDESKNTLVVKYTQGKKNEEIDVIEEMDLYIRGSLMQKFVK